MGIELRRFIIDGLIWLVLGAVLKKWVFPLIKALAENAMLTWADDKIAEVLGPHIQTALSWGIALGLAAGLMWLYHFLHTRFVRAPAVAIHTIGPILDSIVSQIPRHLYAHAQHAERRLGPKVAIAWVLIIAGGISLVVGLILLATTNTPVAKQESGFFNSAPPTPARQPAPPPPQRYTAYEKEQRLRAVDEIYKVISTQIAPLQPEGQSLFGHNLLSLMGDGTADQKLNDHARKVEAAFANLTGLLKQYEYYPDIVQTLSQKPVFNQIEESNAARNLISTVAFIRQHVEPQWAGQALDRDVTLLEARNANQHFEQFLRTITPLLQQKRAEIEKAEIYSGK